MLDPFSEQRLALVAPALADRVRRAYVAFTATTGSTFRVVQGLRTYAEQEVLFRQGPKQGGPGPWVTNARGGYSNHNFGLAVDIVPAIHGEASYQPDWATAHPDWHTMVSCLKAEGLFWGGDWHGDVKSDVDHFQLEGVAATPNGADRIAFTQGGLPRVWAMYGFGVPGVVSGLSASGANDLPLRLLIERTILEDFEDRGPIWTALKEGEQA